MGVVQLNGSAFEVFVAFLRLGLTSFGGPVAHLGYFRDAFVVRRKWIDEAGYADLVALCQFLPGPASSQVGFALGLKRAGALGGLAAFVGFTLPSALLMLAVASGMSFFATPAGEAVAHGLKLVAVAIVAQAVLGMAASLCRDWLTRGIAIVACVTLLFSAQAWMQPLAIALGGLLALAFASGSAGLRPATEREGEHKMRAIGPRSNSPLVMLFVVLLLGLPLLAHFGGPFAMADSFYRAGALVFGGGHVVLPLLEAETVGRGWLGEGEFLAGYGAAQALPGPLFAFAAFLGAAGGPVHGVVGGLIALVFLFLPGLLIIAGALPCWDRLKSRAWAMGFVRGAGAAVVGVLAAALYDPVFTSAVRGPADLAVTAGGFALLHWARAPAWLVVLVVGAAGAGLVLAGMSGPVH